MMKTSHDLIISDEREFLGLRLCLELDLKVTSVGFTQVPYHYLRPSVKPKLLKHICQVCELYNTSNKSSDCHRKNIHFNVVLAVSQPRVCISAHCVNQLMCILQALNCDEYVERLGKEEVGKQGLDMSNIPIHRCSENIIIDNVESGIQGSWTSD